MRSQVRFSLLALIAGVILVTPAPAAQAAFGVENFFAAECKVSTCKFTEAEKAKAEAEGFTQAGGHPNWGLNDFTVNRVEVKPGVFAPSGGIVTHVRSDVSPGFSTNPQAAEKCTLAQFGEKEAIPGTGFYLAPKCGAESEIGFNQVVVYAGEAGDVPVEGTMYNLVQPEGLASDFGVALKLPISLTKAFLEAHGVFGKPAEEQYYAHTFIEGNVEWGAEAAGTGKADYHDYFEIRVSPALPLLK